MKSQIQDSVQLGELVATVFDKAAECSADPQEVSRPATLTVANMLWRAHELASSRPPPGCN